MFKTFLLGFALVAGLVLPASAQVVAFGTSFTQGYGVGASAAYPTLLEAALRQKGYNVNVRNEGVFNDTTQGGLARVNSSVPDGTKVAIVEFGINELHAHSGNVADVAPALRGIGANLRSRGIKTIFVSLAGASRYAGGAFGSVVEAQIKGHRDEASKHPDASVHQAVARALLPRVMAALGKP